MEVIEEEKAGKQARERPQEIKQIFEQQAEKTEKQKPKKKSHGIKLTPEMEKAVDERVEKIINPEKESKENQ